MFGSQNNLWGKVRKRKYKRKMKENKKSIN